MSARREWRLHDHPRRVVVGALEVSLLQQRKTETEACFDVLAVFAQQVTEDLFSLRVLAFANCSVPFGVSLLDRKSTRLNSSHLVISYAVFCLKKKTNHIAK